MVKDKDAAVVAKKKRKAASQEAEPALDVYQSVCQAEEQEAKARNTDEDSQIFDNLLEEIQQKLAQARELKLAKESPESVEELNYLVLEVATNVCGIKKLNRMGKLNEIDKREELAREKQKCDSIVLTYENLVYELHHLNKETNNCLSFKSDDEAIDLVPLEDFMRDAPKEVTGKFAAVATAEQEHALTLARLEWELTQRKALADECKVLEDKKRKIVAEIAERKDKLDSLLPLLNEVVKATVPLQRHLGMPQEVTRNEHPLATLLPDSLYVLFTNVIAYQSFYETSIEIAIIGEQEEAEEFIKAQGEAKFEDSEPEIAEAVVEAKPKRHRKSAQQVDPLQEKKKQLLESHPLQVQLTFAANQQQQGPKLYALFSHYTKLKMITVTSTVEAPSKITSNCAREILSGLNILSELLPNDTGLDSPNPGIELLLRKTGLGSFRALVPDAGYAYAWAQGLCGLDKGGHVEDVLQLIEKRLAARSDLASQMQQLERSCLPQVPQEVALPVTAIATLCKWSGSTYQEFCSKEFAQGLVDEGVVGETDLFYLAKFARDKAHLQAFVVIKNSYPMPAPIYALMVTNNKESLTILNSNEMRDLERKMNCGWDYGPESSPWLLAAQLSRLCAYLDVFLEIQFPKASSTHKFIRSISGRNHKRPFNFRKIGSGVVFTQY